MTLTLPQASPSFPVPSILLSERLEPKATKMQTLSQSKDAEISPSWEQSLGAFPNKALLFNPMGNEGFPQNYTCCWSQGIAVVQGIACI